MSHQAGLLEMGCRLADAVFCGSDHLARGLQDAERDEGVRVPDDVAVIGCDNWAVLAEAERPPLTTCDMEWKRLGTRETGLMLARVDSDLTESGRARCGRFVRVG